jgi:hypothetical protein
MIREFEKDFATRQMRRISDEWSFDFKTFAPSNKLHRLIYWMNKKHLSDGDTLTIIVGLRAIEREYHDRDPRF